MANKDINLPQEMLAQFPRLRALLDSSEINQEFAARDHVANKSKALFNTFGLLSLIFMALTLMTAACHFLLHALHIEIPLYLLWIGAASGLLAFVLSLSSHFLFGFQDEWLKNRFMAERIRQWKFQQFLDGSLVALSQSDHAKFDAELKGRWAKAKFSFLGTGGMMHDFLNGEEFELFVAPSLCPISDLVQEMFDVYRYVRLDYQARYFSSKKETLQALDVWTNAVAKFSLLLAGMLAVAEVVILLINTSAEESRLGWIVGASALAAALLSAATRVARSATAISEETERSISKWVVFKILAERFKRSTSPAERLECMVETERVCVAELREFIRTFRKSDYLL
jgi:hypothetical protein